jgi:hypothetical protein
MNMPSTVFGPRAGQPTVRPSALRSFAATLWRGSPALAIWGLVVLLAMLPMLVALGLDERTLRGASVWSKPLKFHASIALLAWTTAGFMSLLDPARLHSRTLRGVVVALIAASAFELGYIGWQAAQGEASHFYVSDPFHAAMYMLMGAGAMTLTATQAVLAWQVHRHARPGLAPALQRSIVLGLALTFVLGSLAGAVLSGRQPAIGSVPVVGWALGGGDLRPAHFLGIHAAQLLPLIGWWAGRRESGATRLIGIAAALYTLLFAATFVNGL